MTIKQKPLSRRKSYKHFTSEITESVDDFWKVAADGEVESCLSDQTIDFPESSAINDSSLKFKKEFDIQEPPLQEVIISSDKNELINFDQNDYEECLPEENKSEINDCLVEDSPEKKVLGDKTNRERRKSFYEANDALILKAYLPEKAKKQKKSEIKKNKERQLICVEDMKRFSFEKNCHLKIRKMGKAEVALINLEKGAEINDQMCNKNMIVTLLKGSVKFEFGGDSFLLKSGGVCFVKRGVSYSVCGVGFCGSVLSVVYVK